LSSNISDGLRNKLITNLLTILSSCQLDIPDAENMNIEQILESFSVGTERRRPIIPPPTSSDPLVPIRDLDMRSIHKRASDRINRRTTITTINNNENNEDEVFEEDQINNEQTYTTHNNNISTNPISTYQNITKYVSVLMQYLIKSDRTVFDSCIGYKIIESRSTPLSINRPGYNGRHKREIRKLVESASQEYRTNEFINHDNKKENSPSLSSTTNNNNNNNNDVLLISPSDIENNNDNDNNNMNLNETEENNESSSSDSENNKENNVQVQVVNKPKRRRSCCSCPVTNTKFPDVTFTNMPNSVQAPIKATDDDKTRIRYYKKQYQRKLTLLRLGLGDVDKRRTLLVCSNHKYVIETVSVEYEYSNGKTSYTEETIKIPIEQNAQPN
jgi:hypothetical protein